MKDALAELSSDRTLKTAFNAKTLAEFWISVEREYPQLSKAAVDVLTPFGSIRVRKDFLCTDIYNK